MNVLMIHPLHENTLWTFKDILKIVSKKAAYPPFGLLTVAGMLPHHWDIKLIDLNVAPLNADDLRWADYVMIGAILTQEKSIRIILSRRWGHYFFTVIYPAAIRNTIETGNHWNI